jgi:hypothetical protein
MMKPSRIHLALKSLLALTLLGSASAKPLKVYILAGQSNMQGKPSVSVLTEGLQDSRETMHLHKLLVDRDGEPRVFDDVHVAAVSTGPTEKNGPLTVGFGNDLTARRGLKWGPELAFGATLYEELDEPILLIKTAWGGKSLNTDFLSPSGAKMRDGMDTGPYYELMRDHVQQVLANPGKYHPDYEARDGYELAGFVWFQGWNDMVNKKLYPEGKSGRYDLYSELLAHFIRDVRKDFKAPDMPFVIGVMGVGGEDFQEAMAKPADLPEFKDNVVAVRTAELRDDKLTELIDRGWRWQRPKWDPEKKYTELREKLQPLQRKLKEAEKIEDRNERKRQVQAIRDEIESTKYSPEEVAYLKRNKSSQGFHYDGSPKFFARAGEAFAKALLDGGR